MTGYGIWKTTEDKVPMLVQRRHEQQTAFIWAVALDGSPIDLQTFEVTGASGNKLDKSEAVLVRASRDNEKWLLLANPSRSKITATSPDGASWQSDAAFVVR
jgi:hypothetical protein